MTDQRTLVERLCDAYEDWAHRDASYGEFGNVHILIEAADAIQQAEADAAVLKRIHEAECKALEQAEARIARLIADADTALALYERVARKRAEAEARLAAQQKVVEAARAVANENACLCSRSSEHDDDCPMRILHAALRDFRDTEDAK